MGETEEVLSRFHGILVDEIREQRLDYLSGPFTVAEIYQDLTPYGSHRDRIGVEMNGDYEDALLRLLAGEGGYLILESAPALQSLRQELESANPNTGLYREYAAADVRLNPDRLDSQAAAFEAGDDDGLSFLEPEAPAPVSKPAIDTPVEPAGDFGTTAADEAPAPETSLQAEVPTACRWCRATLPERATLNFCPYCGTDVNLTPCPGCGEELVSSWRFCAACGIEVDV